MNVVTVIIKYLYHLKVVYFFLGHPVYEEGLAPKLSEPFWGFSKLLFTRCTWALSVLDINLMYLQSQTTNVIQLIDNSSTMSL